MKKITRTFGPVPGEVIEEVIQEDLESIELVTNSKGEVQIKVKCYAQTVGAAAMRATEMFDQLRVKYPKG